MPDASGWWLGQHKNTVHNGVRLARRLEKFAKVMQSQRLKASKVRKHKQHRHPLRDQYGDAYTQVGRDPLKRIGRDGKSIRRVWLAGISAQRGY